MKDCTRVRRLTKLYVAMNAMAIDLVSATVVLERLLPDTNLKDTFWVKFNGLTDLGRERFLKEIQP